MEKKDPIKPSKVLNKKPNFKKEKLDDEFIKVGLAGLYGQFRSPGVFTRETDISQWDVSQVTDMSTMFTNTQGGPRRGTQLQSQQDVQRIFGELDHPIGISSRQRQNVDGSLDLLGHDLVQSPSFDDATLEYYPRGRLLPLTVQGGEQMMYEASTWMTLNKKKTRWERVKDYFSSIYKRWRHVG
jgi:hypothetical protein